MHDLTCGLADLGWNITVLTATSALQIDDPDKRHRVVRLGRQQKAADSNKSVLGKTLAGLRFLCSCFLWCSFRAQRNDLVFIVSNPPFIGLIGPLLRIVRRLQYLFLFQDLFPRSAVLSGVLPAQGFSTQIWSALMQWICRHSAATVVLNQAMAQQLQQESRHRLPLTVIHNWAIEQGYGFRGPTILLLPRTDFKAASQCSTPAILAGSINTLIDAAARKQPYPISLHWRWGQAQTFSKQPSAMCCCCLTVRPRLPETLAACDLACISLIPGAENTLAPSKLYGILASGVVWCWCLPQLRFSGACAAGEDWHRGSPG